jgi:hypothetical protein
MPKCEHYWMLFMILWFLTLGFAMGWNTRQVKEIDNRVKNKRVKNKQIKRYKEGWDECSQISLKHGLQHCEIPCENDAAGTTETEST